MDKKTAETIIKVLSILGYIGAGLLIFIGLFMTLGANMMGNYMGQMMSGFYYGGFISSMIIFMGVVFIGLGILSIFVSKGLWDHKNWARIVALIFAVIGAVGALFSLPVGVVSLLINGFLIYFYGFEQEVIKLFK